MNYEIVTLEEKKLAGYGARTSNTDPSMGGTIAGLWQKLFGEGTFFSLPDKVNAYTIGLYSDYENGALGLYDITVGCEVSCFDHLPEGLTTKVIPAGKYAKFVLEGDAQKAVGEAWQAIWSLPLERTFTGDFEEYVAQHEDGTATIHIYIAIR